MGHMCYRGEHTSIADDKISASVIRLSSTVLYVKDIC